MVWHDSKKIPTAQVGIKSTLKANALSTRPTTQEEEADEEEDEEKEDKENEEEDPRPYASAGKSTSCKEVLSPLFLFLFDVDGGLLHSMYVSTYLLTSLLLHFVSSWTVMGQNVYRKQPNTCTSWRWVPAVLGSCKPVFEPCIPLLRMLQHTKEHLPSTLPTT